MIKSKTKTSGEVVGIGLPIAEADNLPNSLHGVEGSGATALLAPFEDPHFVEQNPFLFPGNLLSGCSQFDWSLGDESSAAGANIAGNAIEDATDTNDNHSLDRPAWWLLHTKPRQEKRLAETLQRFEIPHYLPVTKCNAVTRGRTRTTLSPLFSGYFFLWGTPEQRVRALETNRIVASHRVDDGTDLRQRLLELALLIQQGVPLTVESRLAAGRRVRVKAGSFKNMEGTVTKRAGKTRLFILVNELLGGVSLAIEEHFLEPVY